MRGILFVKIGSSRNEILADIPEQISNTKLSCDNKESQSSFLSMQLSLFDASAKNLLNTASAQGRHRRPADDCSKAENASAADVKRYRNDEIAPVTALVISSVHRDAWQNSWSLMGKSIVPRQLSKSPRAPLIACIQLGAVQFQTPRFRHISPVDVFNALAEILASPIK